MRQPVGPDDPDHPAAPGVRPFLRNTAPGGRYSSAPPLAPLPGPPPGEQTTTLRPFVLTSGRVNGVDPDIGLETQVSSRPGALSARLSPEQRAIVHLCGQPLSVAEISAQLRMHFG